VPRHAAAIGVVEGGAKQKVGDTLALIIPQMVAMEMTVPGQILPVSQS
jgi:hypothetical protein